VVVDIVPVVANDDDNNDGRCDRGAIEFKLVPIVLAVTDDDSLMIQLFAERPNE
jgi:hypothetical protein